MVAVRVTISIFRQQSIQNSAMSAVSFFTWRTKRMPAPLSMASLMKVSATCSSILYLYRYRGQIQVGYVSSITPEEIQNAIISCGNVALIQRISGITKIGAACRYWNPRTFHYVRKVPHTLSTVPLNKTARGSIIGFGYAILSVTPPKKVLIMKWAK